MWRIGKARGSMNFLNPSSQKPSVVSCVRCDGFETRSRGCREAADSQPAKVSEDTKPGPHDALAGFLSSLFGGARVALQYWSSQSSPRLVKRKTTLKAA